MHADNMALAQEFAASNSERAFATLVQRHVNLVYSVALRRLGNPHDAEEVTQAVFIILAKKAAILRKGTVLSGWLYQTAQLASANFQRAEWRRQRREQEAYMQFVQESEPDVSWQQLSPLLEEAMAKLGQVERDAVVLRFFENRTVREVAAALGLQEAAAQKRINRATDKLRNYFVRRGVPVSAGALLASIGSNAVHAAPVGLAPKIVTVAALKGAAAAGSTLTLIKTTLKIMAWTKEKTAVVVGVSMLLAAGTATITVKEISRHRENSVASRTARLDSQKSDLINLEGTWSGREVGARGSSSLVFQGSTIEFHGADPNEWYKATFSIREDTTPKQLVAVITDSPAPQYVGKTAYAIYEIQDGVLILTGNEPGNPVVPTNFNARGARGIVFKKK